MCFHYNFRGKSVKKHFILTQPKVFKYKKRNSIQHSIVREFCMYIKHTFICIKADIHLKLFQIMKFVLWLIHLQLRKTLPYFFATLILCFIFLSKIIHSFNTFFASFLHIEIKWCIKISKEIYDILRRDRHINTKIKSMNK